MFQSKWEFGLMAKDALALRQAVLVEEMGMDREDAFDHYDEIAAHIYVWDNEGPIAAGRIYPLGEATGIGAIVTDPSRRQEPFADLVLRILLDKAQTLAGDPIMASPLPEDIPLFSSFGFKKVGENAQVYTVPRGGICWHSDCHDD
ncbi:Acetyltransferase [bioreactor metagenome]|uniref:Acetyltransferase n=1 Tax=bioreactor metagenome TaxID=1076179 RepID=A0A645GLP6_9ZZZZ|nr:hypothetical protein [Candidatus Pelethousia sp.]